MAAGEAFTTSQHQDIERAIGTAHRLCGYRFSVYVGPTEGSDARAFAERLHSRLDSPETSVLVFVDPNGRRLEIVTGTEARRDITDTDAGLVALSMQASFVAGDLVGGITAGLQQLADHARHPETLHADEMGA